MPLLTYFWKKVSETATSDVCFVFLEVGPQTEAGIEAGKMSFVLPAFHPAPGSVVGAFLCLTD